MEDLDLSEWEIHRSFVERAKLIIVMNDENRNATLFAMRRTLPEFREIGVSEIRARVGATNRFELEDMCGREARKLGSELENRGVLVEYKNTSVVGMLRVNKVQGYAWIIEDDERARRVSEEMIAAGVPVVDIEA